MAILAYGKKSEEQSLGNIVTEFKGLDLIPVENRSFSACAVRFVIDDFTCRCPITKQPDYAAIEITYTPKHYYLETKSLKLYLETFRDTGVFHEHLTTQILQTLVSALDPLDVVVITLSLIHI